jgi:hypothetical protein
VIVAQQLLGVRRRDRARPELLKRSLRTRSSLTTSGTRRVYRTTTTDHGHGLPDLPSGLATATRARSDTRGCGRLLALAQAMEEVLDAASFSPAHVERALCRPVESAP